MERSYMRRTKFNFGKFHRGNLLKLAAVTVVLTGGFPIRAVAQQPGQKTFSSAEQASNAFVTAAQSNNEKAMLDILGPDGRQIVSSGDDTEDAQSRADFVRRYQEMHRLGNEPDGTTTLYIGAKNWPTPVPLVSKGSSWYFDTEAGKQEILFRRIGRNEISTIRVCHELVAAQKEFYFTQHNVYAQKIFSGEAQHNGLYWKATDGQPQSPIGPLVASAVAEGYAKGQDRGPTPYRGCYYHILTRPAEYRSSGVMTFVIGIDGVVYQKDLGKKTDLHAKDMKEYNPDSSWQEAEEQHQETTGDQKTK